MIINQTFKKFLMGNNDAFLLKLVLRIGLII